MESVDSLSLAGIGILEFIVSVITFVIFCIIAYRLKIIMINTYKSSKTPGVNNYAEAKSFEAIGDKVQALRHYNLAYWSLKELYYKKFTWRKERISVKDLEEKIGVLEAELSK